VLIPFVCPSISASYTPLLILVVVITPWFKNAPFIYRIVVSTNVDRLL